MVKKQPRIGIGLPLVTLKAKPLVSLCSTLCTTKAQMALLVTEGAYIPHNRILLVGLAKEERCTHLFFMDHDMFFAADTCTRLLAHDKDLIAAPYNMRALPRQTVVFGLGGERLPPFFNADGTPSDTNPGKPFEVGAIGCGCMLVKMSVFERLAKPWFQALITDQNELQVSEDVWFCNQARAAGVDVWCDPTLVVGHIGEAIY